MSSHLTKRAIETSFRDLLNDRPLHKITVADITDGCGVSRMTFYYHFEDVYDLLGWTWGDRAARAFGRLDCGAKYQGGSESGVGKSDWQTGLLRLLNTLREDKPVVMNVYRSMGRGRIEDLVHPCAHALLLSEMGARAGGGCASCDDREFIVSFFEHAIVGTLIAWVEGGMRDDPRAIVRRIDAIMYGQAKAMASHFTLVGPVPEGTCKG